jgi:hypothetical protein
VPETPLLSSGILIQLLHQLPLFHATAFLSAFLAETSIRLLLLQQRIVTAHQQNEHIPQLSVMTQKAVKH